MGYSGLARAVIANNGLARLAKPRGGGGRRPGALRPPASPSPSFSQQQQQNQNSLGDGDRIDMNGAQQQQGGFNFGQQLNGNQPNQNSSSFPPFPTNSFNPPFAAPTSGFNFNVGQTQQVNNPFTAINTHNAPPPEPSGFQGNIFNLPPQKMSPFNKFLEGEQKPLFAPGAPDLSALGPLQTPNNPFNQSSNQQQPVQTSAGIFSQPSAQQQPPNNVFGQSIEQKATQPTTDIFAHLKTPQDRSSSNPFSQSIVQFQQSQSAAQQDANLFANFGNPQLSSAFFPQGSRQGSTSPTQGGGSMMQISPDPSPQSRPFGFLNQPNSQTQSSPTKDSAAQGGGGSLFDRISKPPPETSPQFQLDQPKNTSAQGTGGSLFDRISKPPNEADTQAVSSPTKNDTATDHGNLFNMPQPSSTSKVLNENGPNSPSKISERKIVKPTLFQTPSEDAHPSYKAIFSGLKLPPTSQPSSSPASPALSTVPQPTLSPSKGDSISPNRGDSNIPSSSSSTQQTIEQAQKVSGVRRKFGPSPAPEGYSEEEARIWSQDWWTSFYVRHKEKRIKYAESQCDERIKAVLEGFDPLAQIAGSKRKPIMEHRGNEEDDIQGKKARVESQSIFTQESRGTMSNGTNVHQPTSNRDTPVQQLTGKNKRSAEEEPERDNGQGTADNGKKARGHDPVSYPSLPGASAGSQTSSIFKNILDKKEEAKVNGTQNDKATPLFQFSAPSGASSSAAQSTSTLKPSSTTSVPPLYQPGTESPFKSSFASFNPDSSTSDSSLFTKQQSTSNGAPATISTSTVKSSTSAASPSPNPFSLKPVTSSETPSDTTKALAVAFSSGATTSTASNSTPFFAKPMASVQTSSENAQAPAFKVPTFGAATSSNAPSSSTSPFKPFTSGETTSEAPKAPAFKVLTFGAATPSNVPSSSTSPFKPFTSGETTSEAPKAPAFKVLTFGAATPSNVPSSSTSPFKPFTSGETTSEAPKAPTFKVPTFGAGASSPNFISQFGQAAEKTAAEAKQKRKAAEYDSDEEDLASWEKRDAEEQRAKRKKIEEEIQGKAAKLVDGQWIIAADDDKPSTSVMQAKSADPNVSVLSLPRAQLTNGHNIFGHLSAEESGAEGSKTGDADADDEDDDDDRDDEPNGQHQVRGPFDYDESESGSDEDEDDQGQSKGAKALSNPFGATENGLYDTPSRNDYGTAEDANEENTGRSIFDRISRDKDGKPIREIPQPDGQAASQTSNVFGQSFKSGSSGNLFSQPSNATSSFTSTNTKTGESPKGDHTWKADSPIKFGETSNPPAVNVTFPSPSKPAFGGLFGANATSETPTKPTPSVFSTPPAKTPSVGFGFGFMPTTTSLAPPSKNGSNATSRATSPGATTGESANESTADGGDDKAEKQEQIDLTSRGPGEENEDVVLQVKAKALKWDQKSSNWDSKGVGPLRILKNRESHQTRVLLRQDPSGRIVINFALSKSFTYESSQSKTVRMPFVGESGKIESWIIKVGNDDDAKKLASALEEHKR